jgi:hypothetical protein
MGENSPNLVTLDSDLTELMQIKQIKYHPKSADK